MPPSTPLPEGAEGRDDGDADRDLVARAKTDRAAFAPLYARYQPAVLRFCRGRLGDAEAAEDAASLVFAKALAALPGHRPEASFRGWLFAIARHVVADAHRGRRPEAPLDAAGEVPDAAPSPEDLALAGDDGRALRAALMRLPPAQRRVVELRLAGLTGAEIAAALGTTPGAVKINQFRAVARLRVLLGVEPPGEPGGDPNR